MVMTREQKLVGIIVGTMLGAFALVILSFVTFMRQAQLDKAIEHQEKIEMVKSIKDTCGTVYPVVHAAIYRDRTIVECRTE